MFASPRMRTGLLLLTNQIDTLGGVVSWGGDHYLGVRGRENWGAEHQLFKTQSSFWPTRAGFVAPQTEFKVSDSVK